MFTGKFQLKGDQFYTLIISSFKPGENLGGILELETN